MGKHIGGRGTYGIPRDLTPPTQDRPPALLSLSGWEGIPVETREPEDEQLRQDLEAGANLPPTYMQSESAGTLHTTTIQETDPYNDINPTGEYTLRENYRKGTVKAYNQDGKWLGEMITHRLRVLHSRFAWYWDPTNEPTRERSIEHKDFA